MIRCRTLRSCLLFVSLVFFASCSSTKPTQKKPQLPFKTDFSKLLQSYSDAFDQGQYTDAKDIAEKILPLAEKELEKTDEKYLGALLSYANVNRILRNYEMAEIHYQKLFTIADSMKNPNDIVLGQALNGLGLINEAYEKNDKAKAFYLEALEKTKNNTDAKFITSSVTNNLGALYFRAKKYDESIASFQKALELDKELFGEYSHHMALGTNNLANVYINKGELEQAKIYHTQAIETYEKSGLSNHPDCAVAVYNLGQVNHMQGNYMISDTLYNKSLEILEKAYGTDHYYLISVLSDLADIHDTMGNRDKAAAYLERSKKIASLNSNDSSGK